MAQRIEIGGPAKYGVVGLVLVFVLGAWLAPSLLSSATGSAGRSFSWLRGGYVEQHKTNLTGHWLTSAKGRYRTSPIVAVAGETVAIGHAIAVREGSVGVRLRRYGFRIVPERVRGRGVSDDASGRFEVPVPVTGLYFIELAYVGFAGTVTLDWAVE